MRIVLGIICVLFGGFGWIGQTISGTSFSLAQKLGLQEKSEGTDPLFRLAETNTARWDAFVLWTLLASGILMLTNNKLWPFISLIAGGIYLDAAGREAAKYISLRKGGVRIGTAKDMRVAAVFFSVMLIIAVWVILYSLWFLTGQIK